MHATVGLIAVTTSGGATHSMLVTERAGAEADGFDLRTLVADAAGDPDAFAQLYRRYVERVYAFAAWRSGSRAVAEEVVSATFERAWQGLVSFEWKGGGFEPWLFRIASTELAGWYRRERRSDRPRAQMVLRDYALGPLGTGTIGGLDPEPEPDDLDDIRRVLATLTPRYQEAIALRFWSGLSNEEAAEAMGCSRPAMAVIVHRAITALRRGLGRLEEEQ